MGTCAGIATHALHVVRRPSHLAEQATQPRLQAIEPPPGVVCQIDLHAGVGEGRAGEIGYGNPRGTRVEVGREQHSRARIELQHGRWAAAAGRAPAPLADEALLEQRVDPRAERKRLTPSGQSPTRAALPPVFEDERPRTRPPRRRESTPACTSA
jgi:hypothetical protein